MRIYLLRHGIAEDQRTGSEDASRALTKQGLEGVERVVQAAARAGVPPSLILTSPYLRARDTAAIAKRLLGTSAGIIETATLTPDADPQLAWAEICDHRQEPALLLAGHNPSLTLLLNLLLGVPGLQFDFGKGALVALEVTNFRGSPDGVLLWAVPPSLVC